MKCRYVDDKYMHFMTANKNHALNLVSNQISCLANLKGRFQSLIFCDLLLYPSMQVVILEYVVPRVLVNPCIKFDKVSTRKT
jgi:hypothetical protein